MNSLRPVLEIADDRRANIRKKVLEGFTQAFPLQAGKHTVNVSNLQVETRDYSSNEQKRALLAGRTLSERIKGDLTVHDADGKTLSQAKNFTLMQLPYFTQRHTFIVDGTEYSVSNQLRQKPGAYVRRRGNEELEASFNLSKGANFKVFMEPDKGLLYMSPSRTAAKIPLLPVLSALGVPHQDIAKHWGAEVAALNRDAFKDPTRHVDKLYQALIPTNQQTHATPEAKASALRTYFDNTAMDPEVNKMTLGHAFDKANSLSILAASKKLLDINRAAADVDDRDSLSFKSFLSVDDFMKERVALEAKAIRNKIGWKLDAHKGDIRKAVQPGFMTRAAQSFLTGSTLSAVPMQINPMELLDDASRVTVLGEGGIGSERAISVETREVHPTHFGILDPARTPEGGKVGVDVRATLGAQRDNNGNLYARVIDIKTKQPVAMTATQMANAVIAFPHEDLSPGKLVDVLKDGRVQKAPSSQVTHQTPDVHSLYGPTSNLLPMIYGIQGNRVIMASKHQSQALPLIHREAPLVQVGSWQPDKSYERQVVGRVVPTAPVAGTITKIDDGFIYLRPDAGKHAAVADADAAIWSTDYLAAPDLGVKTAEPDTLKLHYDTYFPLASKTMLHNELRVKPGDRVAAGQMLADSNFTKDDTLALGTNLRVGYMAYRGLNSNDGIVISQGAAEKLVSDHMYQHALSRDGDIQLGREKHRSYYGARYTAAQYANLDDDGVVKSGVVLHKGDPIFVGVRPSMLKGDALILGRLSKSLVKPYDEVVDTWNHEYPGTVVDVAKTPARVAASIRTQQGMNVGDKLTNRYGGKGVVSMILPDDKMIKDEKGRPLEILFTSAGIVSRINPAQIIETALGKVAEHTGKPVVVPHYEPGRDNVQFARDMLKQHGLSDKETVFDPVTGKHIPNVVVGKSYILKLFKTTDSNWSAHGAERYDFNQQPSRGGDEGAKGIGKMEFDGLVAHNARNVLRESAAIKSQRNDQFWRSVQLGLPTPAPSTPFAYNKLLNMLTGAGVKIDKSGSRLALGPLTDKDITEMSSGSLKDAALTVRAKDLKPETGGLFDPAITGGLNGTKWSHVDLHEPIVNPVFEEPVRRLLGLTQKQFTENLGKGGQWFKRELDKIDVDQRMQDLRAQTKRAKGPELDGLIKQIKYLDALKTKNLTPGNAYVLSKVPVTPPVIRPVLPLPNGELQTNDANLLYKDAFLANTKLKDAVGSLPEDALHTPRQHLYDAVSAVFGVGDPVSPSAEKRDAKGYLAMIAGTRPGTGFFQSKLMKRQQDISGRGTIAPDPTLSLDEVGIPEGMLWGMYGKFVIGRLVRRGYAAADAQRMVDEKSPIAREELVNESKERPVFINRAPSLHRFNVIGAFPKIVEGKTIKLNPFAEKGSNSDYDGDTMQVHAPVTQAGIEDVKKMTLSNLVFSDKRPGVLNVAPEMESVLGLYRATKGGPATGPSKTFANQADAMAAYHRGEIGLHDHVEIKH